jgi:NAD(P)-dependent dehydrogenase (short-subunit alcohol dehydrogenase family)
MRRRILRASIATVAQQGGAMRTDFVPAVRSAWYVLVLASMLGVGTARAAERADAPSPEAKTQRAVLVTGASTGIGRRITERLAANGFWVYATARKDTDLESLAKIPNVQPLRMDVTRDADIAAAVAAVTASGRGLYGLVNNAGVAVSGAFADTTPEDFDFVMQVNAYGPYRVTRAFTPLLVESRGRITTIGSISGVLSSRDLGVYSMSKHAVEAFADSLALQMAPAGVAVSVVEPGNYDSEIGRSAAARTGKPTPLADRSRYKPPDEVADAVLQFLTEPTPKRRYMVVPNQREAEVTIRKAIEELVQLNEGHAYTYDRDALVKMLEEALATARPKTGAAAP